MSANAAGAPIVDASTVIVLREADVGLQTFMLCRHVKSGFMGGAHVFPGGKVDAEDLHPSWARRIDRPPDAIASVLGEKDSERGLGLLVAGIRETFEEAGVMLGSTRSDADLEDARRRLLEGAAFNDIAAELDLHIESAALAPYARWVTPEMETKRFDTRFYVARLPEGQAASHDGSETTSAVWLRPADAIDRMVSGKIKLAPPTVRTLRWLADFREAASVMADAVSRKPPLVRPRIVSGEGGWFLTLPGDPEHPEDEPVLPGATRMVFHDGAWRDAT
jgi:8-oxo-dGTP pyrophosphatase MutT (NUDIX family)